MKKVAHYVYEYLPITQTWIYSQLINLTTFTPIVYTRKIENLDIFPFENIHSLNLTKGIKNYQDFFQKLGKKFWGYYPSFRKQLKKDAPDLIHAHFGYIGFDCLKLKKIAGIPLVTTFYGYDVSLLPAQHPEWMQKYQQLFQKGDTFLAEGHFMKKTLLELGCPEQKIRVQHLGIDNHKIPFTEKSLQPGETIRILCAASFREKKGLPLALEAFGRLKKKNPELRAELTLIGDSNGRPEEESIKEQIEQVIQKFELQNSIHKLGYQPYPVWQEKLRSHHIFLHPSKKASNGDTEGGAPVSIIEASAAGLPVLATTHCDIPEVVIDGKSGFLVPENDVLSLTEKLKELTEKPELWKKMGKAGRNHIEEHYDIKKQVERLEKIYRDIVT